MGICFGVGSKECADAKHKSRDGIHSWSVEDTNQIKRRAFENRVSND